MNQYFIKCTGHIFLTCNLPFQQKMLFRSIVTGQHFTQAGFNFIRRDIREKPKLTSVDTKDWDAKGRHHPSGAQDISVPANSD